MSGNITFEEWESEKMKDPAFRACVDRLEAEYQEAREEIVSAPKAARNHIYTEAIQPDDGREFLYAIVGPAADGGGPTPDAAYKLVHLQTWDTPVIEGATIEEARIALWGLMEEGEA